MSGAAAPNRDFIKNTEMNNILPEDDYKKRSEKEDKEAKLKAKQALKQQPEGSSSEGPQSKKKRSVSIN
jgi:hypothetical protein